ncbi:SMI1/KNR4 family protein [Streptomyces sp. NPDC127098]|uniref:SMI1/KNR4 family protein n=1 Tax=Streptomyces sp. NPDC127098 TaxID=3347137 RepID=UPI0036693AE4
MNEALAELVRVAPPGAAPGASDWSRTAAALGVNALPADYTELADRYGGGHFDDYLCLLHPGCVNPDYNLLAVARQQAQALPELWKFEPKPPQLRAPDHRVVPWAIAEDGQTLYWLIAPGHEPARWTVMVNEGRGPYWEHHDTGSTGFLAELLTGRRQSEILGDLSGPDHRFDPLPTTPGH